ncbi:uncharacterized protein LOC128239485 isoform X2 [Mya arenaria]|uniref:uncharacterized protein LOC128239485 isoform X2 n=1 Tax=Mya arenaria TaxID=6604 RepID=UPI0022E65453|nr:uncharacterized protein LOC128239485 isoform X2 [Mya arenaria]
MHVLFKAVLFGLLFTIDRMSCANLANKYLVNIHLDGDCDDSNIDRCLERIVEKLCRPSSAVNCFLKYKVVGDFQAVFALNVRNAIILDRRINSIGRLGFRKVQTIPLLDYGVFCKSVLKVEDALVENVNETLLMYDLEALWIEVNIEFTGLNGTEVIDLWKREAESVLQTIGSGVHLVPLKVSGDKSAHFFATLTTTQIESIFFLNPLFDENGDRVKVNIKTVLQLLPPTPAQT